MSVWTDMGLADGRMKGVTPCVFLNTAFAFFEEVRSRTLENYRPSPRTFDLRRKGYFPDDYYPGGNFTCFDANHADRRLGMPVPERFWNGPPVWSTIFSLGEADVLGEAVLPSPAVPGRSAGDTAWPLQRYRLIQRMRYVTVPLEIMIFNGHDHAWLPDPGRALDHWYRRGWWYEAYDRPFSWSEEGTCRIRATIPAYWTCDDTVCRIGFEVEKMSPGSPDPPIAGCFWHEGGDYLSAACADPNGISCYMRGFGVADLATHPDFAQYFDTE